MGTNSSKEIDYLRNGNLTLYILKIIEGMPKVDMSSYYALIAQEIESVHRLRAGKSMLYSRIQALLGGQFLKSEIGASSNPRAKKPVHFLSLTASGKKLLNELSREQKRITDSLNFYR